MQVFLTGATGYVGRAVLEALLKGSHAVTALVRSGEKARELKARGVTPILGEIASPARWREAAAGKDAIIHAAIDYGSNGVDGDRIALETFTKLAPPVFIYTSGIWVIGAAPEPVDESASTSHPALQSAWRAEHEKKVMSVSWSGARNIIVRPGIVYGGARGIVSDMLKDASNGLVRVIGPGDNHWPLVYGRDLGDLYHRLLVAPRSEGIYHATDGSTETVNEIVEAIAAAVAQSPSVRHVPLDEARKKLGPLADALALDQIVRSSRVQEVGWAPTLHSVTGNVPRLLEEFRRGKEAA
jgi:nucleoside-diphosphate-sugar epimerase